MVFRHLPDHVKAVLYDADRLAEAYARLTMTELSESLGVDRDTINYHLRRHGIQRHLGKRIIHLEIDGEMCKRCTQCREWCPTSEFVRSRKASDRLGQNCAACRRRRREAANTPEYRERRQARNRRRERTDLSFKIRRRLRGRLYHVLIVGQKSARTEALLGCSVRQLRAHLEDRFTDGMSWDNYGRNGWEIDHVIPCASFDLSDPAQQRACFHYTNLQPLWRTDNRVKGASQPCGSSWQEQEGSSEDTSSVAS